MNAAADLYRLVIGGTDVWTMTSADRDVIYNDELYKRTALGRGGIESKNDMSRSNVDVKLPLDHPIATLLLGSWMERLAVLTIFRKKPLSTSVIWKGRLTSAVPDDQHIKMVFESVYTSMRRPGLRARFQKLCRHPLYGRGCWLDPEDFAHAGTLNAITGRVLTVPEADAQADGFFNGGMVRAPDGTLTYISDHVGTQLTVNRVSGSLAAPFAAEGPGVAVTLYPGCNHSYSECESKFANDDNYGGFDYIPEKNPMGGSSIV